MLFQSSDQGIDNDIDKIDVMCDIFAVNREALCKAIGVNPNVIV